MLKGAFQLQQCILISLR